MKTSERERMVRFLKRHVIGKAVGAAPITTQTDEGQLTSAYEDDMAFGNLVETAQGFSFDMTTLSRGTRYTRGKEMVAEGILNVVRVIRYEMTERLSSGHMVGYARFVTSTNTHPDPFAGTVFFVRMWLRDDTLEVDERHVGYADVVSADGGYKPVATEGTYTYSVADAGLVVEYRQATFDVDPETLKRTPTSDEFPPQVSREIVFPPDLQAA